MPNPVWKTNRYMRQAAAVFEDAEVYAQNTDSDKERIELMIQVAHGYLELARLWENRMSAPYWQD